MHKDRLLMLADALEMNAADPVGMKFDLSDWYRAPAIHGEKEYINQFDMENAFAHGWKPQRDCGTVGCAIGLAAITPVFNEMGLITDGRGAIVYDGWRHWDAIERFFEIDEKTSEYLFMSGAYEKSGLPTKGAEGERAVAERIRKTVA